MRTIFGIILAAAALLSVTAMTLLFVMPAAWGCAWIRSGGGHTPRNACFTELSASSIL